MSKTHQINSDFWIDDYTANLDPIEKLLFLYLLTNPDANIAGVYQLPIKSMSVDTGIEREMVERILGRFSRDQKILFREGWIAVKNRKKYNKQDNPSIQTAVDLIIKAAPAFVLEFVELDTVSPPCDHPNINKDISIGISKGSKDKDNANLNDTEYIYVAETKEERSQLDALISHYRRHSPLLLKPTKKSPFHPLIGIARDKFRIALKRGLSVTLLSDAIQRMPEMEPWKITDSAEKGKGDYAAREREREKSPDEIRRKRLTSTSYVDGSAEIKKLLLKEWGYSDVKA